MIHHYRNDLILSEIDILKGVATGLNAIGAGYDLSGEEPTWDEVKAALVPSNPFVAAKDLAATRDLNDPGATLNNAGSVLATAPLIKRPHRIPGHVASKITTPVKKAYVMAKSTRDLSDMSRGVRMASKAPSPMSAVETGFQLGSYVGRAPSLAISKGVASIQDHAAAKKFSDGYDKQYNPEMLPKRDLTGVNTAKLNAMAAKDRIADISARTAYEKSKNDLFTNTVNKARAEWLKAHPKTGPTK